MFVRSQIKLGSVVCLYSTVLPSVNEMEGMYATGASFFEDVLLVEFMCLV